MSHYEQVKSYYERGLWKIDRVKRAVVKEWITPAEYKEITGEPYKEVI